MEQQLLNSSVNALTTSVPETKTDRLQEIRLAVLGLINMNDMLYTHLGSTMFDVPHIDKNNILLKTKLLHKQRDDYMNIFINHRDYKFHQKQLDIQILTNRRLRQYVKEAREMFADKQNPLYSRKMFKTDTIFPDAAKRKLPKTLPMTYLCDHLLNIYHYMHNARIAEVINELVAEQNSSLPKAEDKTNPSTDSRPLSIVGDTILTVQTARNTPGTAKEKRLKENKAQNVGNGIPDLQHTVTQQKSCITSETDLVGQILQLGLECKNKQPSARRLCFSSYNRDINTGSFSMPLHTAQSDAEVSNKHSVTTADSITEIRVKENLGKPLGCKSACMTGEKRTSDTLSEEVQREINAKRLRTVEWLEEQSACMTGEKRTSDTLSEEVQREINAKPLRTVEWLEEQALTSRNKHLLGSRPKPALIAKSRKDHATRHEMTKATQLQPIKLSLKKCDKSWVIIW